MMAMKMVRKVLISSVKKESNLGFDRLEGMRGIAASTCFTSAQ